MIVNLNSVKNNIVYLPKIIFFFLLYFLITKESLETFFILLTLTIIVFIFSNQIKNKQDKGFYLGLISFILILPLSLKINFLPTGYQYISISLIGSILYLNLDKSRIRNSNPFKTISLICTSFLAPTTYLSGPSATIKEILDNKNNFQLLPSLKSIRKESIYLAISGFFRITLGYFLLSKASQINYLYPFNNINIQFIFSFIIFGFYYFWKYYLLFSGASELCKAFLSTIGINVIDNFKKAELSVFYHDIWGTWHLNITDRVRQYLYTPITLFALRKSAKFNKFIKFIIVEGLPVVSLFLILGIWHGGRPKDFLFGCVSTVLVLISRSLSRNKFIRTLLENNLLLEIFRILNLIIFGTVLSIYELPFINNSENFENFTINKNIFFFLLFSIYLYYRFKSFNFKIQEKGKGTLIFEKGFFGIFELASAIIIQIFFINVETIRSDFLYFAN